MWLTRLALTRTVFIVMVFLALCILGIYSYTKMYTDLLPAMNFPYVIVITIYPGASPETIESEVTKPIEDILSSTPQLNTISSISREGYSMVELQFKMEANADTAALDVQRKVESIKANLPKDIYPPNIMKVDISMLPTMTIAFSSSERSFEDLTAFLKDNVKDPVQRVAGIASVDISGGLDREIQVKVDQDKLAENKISILQLTQALGNSNLNIPAGSISEAGKVIGVRTDGEFHSINEVRNLIIPPASPMGGIMESLLTSQLEGAEKQAAKLASSVNQASSQIDQADYALNQATNAYLQQQQQVEQLKQASEAAQAGVDSLKKQYSDLQKIPPSQLTPEQKALLQALPGMIEEAEMKALEVKIAYQMAEAGLGQTYAGVKSAQAGKAQVEQGYKQAEEGLAEANSSVSQMKEKIEESKVKIIRLGDVAEVSEGFKQAIGYTRFNGNRSISMVIQKQTNANLVEVAKNIKETLKKIEFPSDIKYQIVSDQSEFTNDAINGVQTNLWQAIFLTALILLVFLHSWRNAFIVLVAIPTSLLSTIIVMFFFGFTFNIISLMGLALTIGILVDDSIVILENINRHLKLGKTPFTAALDGRTEIGLAAIAITTVDVVVFAPVAFLSGMVGQVFKQFGLTIVVTTLFSLLVSFTLTPMLASKLLGKIRKDNWLSRLSNKFSKGFERGIEGLRNGYKVAIRWSLKHRTIIVSICAILFIISVLAIYPFKLVGTEFMTSADRGEFSIQAEMPSGTDLEKTTAAITILENNLKQIPEIKYFVSEIGQGGTSLSLEKDINKASIEVKLKPKSERKKTTSQIIDETHNYADKIPGLKVQIIPTSIMPSVESPLVIEIKGKDIDKLKDLSQQVEKIVKETKGTVDVNNTWKEGAYELKICPDQEKCNDNAISSTTLAMAVRNNIAGMTGTKYRSEGTETEVNVSLAEEDKDTIEKIKNMKFINNNGETITLNQVADITEEKAPQIIERKEKERVIKVNANLKDRPLGDVNSDIMNRVDKEIKLPIGYTIEPGAMAVEMGTAFQDLSNTLILSIILIYMVLAALYQSYLDPFAIMFALPVSLLGVVLGLFITGKTFNIISMIGIILLMGLVAKNSILLVDYTRTLRSRGMERNEAIVEGGYTRLRPIIMTTMALIFGMLPLALGIEIGSEMRQSMGIAVIGGLTTSWLLALFLVPVMYSILDDAKNFFRRK